MKDKRMVTVVIPVKHINAYLLDENLPALDEQTFRDFETILLPNTSSELDYKLQKKYPWLNIVPTFAVTRPAQKRDIGVQKARGEIIAFIDDDAYPTKNWLENAVTLFKKEKVAAVCGPGVLPHKVNHWEEIFDEVFKTWLGGGGYAYRFERRRKQYVDDYPSMNFLIKKTIFDELGGFNNDYWPGEDSKLCNDLVYKKKEKILYDPEVTIYHHRRVTLTSYLKQHSQYGFHRGAFFAHGDKNSQRLAYLIPSFLVIYTALYFVFIYLYTSHFISWPLFLFFSFPLLGYILLNTSIFIQTLIKKRKLFIALGVPLVIFLTHYAYGILFVKGFISGLTKKDNIYG